MLGQCGPRFGQGLTGAEEVLKHLEDEQADIRQSDLGQGEVGGATSSW